ncbi:uncharacterized protein [Anabrus simplex]|uniref:uncharacterized protein isoform X2 n=1 Tax=Anabrus simplex TaxID=316456 RepID=UPI0035A38EA7
MEEEKMIDDTRRPEEYEQENESSEEMGNDSETSEYACVMNATKEMEKPMKRSRTPNWDSMKKNLSKEINEYASIIESKRTDMNTNKSKITAWNTVYKKFMELNQQERCLPELKQWRCMKLEAKRVLSEHRQAVSQTGGEPKPPSPCKDVTDVVEMIPLEFQEDMNEFNGTFPEESEDF